MQPPGRFFCNRGGCTSRPAASEISLEVHGLDAKDTSSEKDIFGVAARGATTGAYEVGERAATASMVFTIGVEGWGAR